MAAGGTINSVESIHGIIHSGPEFQDGPLAGNSAGLGGAGPSLQRTLCGQ